MPLFARRRLQSMLDDISPRLDASKERDLVNRLEDKRIDQVLPAEIELALLWAFSRLGEIDIEPYWWGDEKRPDLYTETFLDGEPAAIEIAAPNDNEISGEDAMDGVAFKISTYANQVRRGLGDYLYFRFQERSGYENGAYFRRRLAPSDFNLTPEIQDRVRMWVETTAIDREHLRLIDDGLDVVVEKRTHKQLRYHNFWCSMPPETHSIHDNPLYKLLNRKLRQLRAAPTGTRRLIFLGDAGSTLVRNVRGAFGTDATGRTASGRRIISAFVLENAEKIDAVVTLAPHREYDLWGGGRGKLRWRAQAFTRPGFALPSETLDRLFRLLPSPRFEGYQTRSLFRQGFFSPKARGWWLGMGIRTKRGDPMEIRFSARALMDLLAGRIDVDQFRYALGERQGEANLFRNWLDKGLTIQAASFETGGIDEDDDHLVFKLADDPAARRLALPAGSTSEKDSSS